MIRPILICISILIWSGTLATNCIQAQTPLDGRHVNFRDELLNNLTGDWKLRRKIRGQTIDNAAHVEWVLNHQFLMIHMKNTGNPVTYDAMVFIGYDNTSERYVVHWLDNFGGRFSETLGYGVRSGNSIKFVFEYPDGPFHNTFKWTPENESWSFTGEQKSSAGKWEIFAEDTLRRK